MGTFVMLEIDYPEASGWYPFFDELKEIGMNTVVIVGIGGFSRKGESPTGELTGSPFKTEVITRFLQAAKDKQFNVYVGLSSNNPYLTPFGEGDANDTSTPKGALIQFSLSLIETVKGICNENHWGWADNFIKGIYLPQEMPVVNFKTDPDSFDFLQKLSAKIRGDTLNNSKKIMISPYFWEEDNYETVRNNIYYAVENSDIDIFAPMDSVGTVKVTSFRKSRDHFDALNSAIWSANHNLNKHAEAWANIETITLPWDDQREYGIREGYYQIPQEFKTLRWQLRAVTEFIHPYQTITWIYQYSMTNIDGLPNVIPYSVTRPGRRRLKHAYLNEPIIIAVFKYYDPPQLVVKGYNFGEQGQNVAAYLHFTATTTHVDSEGNTVQDKKSFSTQTDVKFVAGLQELWIPFNSIPNIDINEKLEAAVRSGFGTISYYASENPEAGDPYFPEA